MIGFNWLCNELLIKHIITNILEDNGNIGVMTRLWKNKPG